MLIHELLLPLLPHLVPLHPAAVLPPAAAHQHRAGLSMCIERDIGHKAVGYT
jgi:hypothetical protein